jgi:hypothetical protein
MATESAHPLLTPGDQRWKQFNDEQDAERDARMRALTVAERLDRGMCLSRTAAELRRAAWEARHGHTAT